MSASIVADDLLDRLTGALGSQGYSSSQINQPLNLTDVDGKQTALSPCTICFSPDAAGWEAIQSRLLVYYDPDHADLVVVQTVEPGHSLTNEGTTSAAFTGYVSTAEVRALSQFVDEINSHCVPSSQPGRSTATADWRQRGFDPSSTPRL